MHAVEVVQETLARLIVLALGLGVLAIVQLDPFHASANVSVVPLLLS
ncbi:MAG TPA: hypothetical protein VEF89_08075 [Solirubrobacteraceae bacterium]|nr:hypothetical protein [Solirubrobacteraceae bacterium]